jgi:hypothetical protein
VAPTFGSALRQPQHVGPNSVRPRPSAAGPYMLQMGFAKVTGTTENAQFPKAARWDSAESRAARADASDPSAYGDRREKLVSVAFRGTASVAVRP